MNTINIAADATAQRIGIGNQYENLATAVVFDCSKFAEDHGAGTAQVIHRRPTESVGYVCTNVSQTNNTVTWLVTDDDTSFTGKGLVQLRWYVNDVLRESVIFPTYILPSVVSSDDAPADVKSALEQIMEWVNDNTISIEDLDERIANYFDEHPIPTPVTSVNEKLGDVVLTAEDVGAYSTEEADEKFCVPDGEYEELNAGTAKQLLSDSYTLDQVPYLFRKSPDSDRAVEEIVGGTVVWNQWVNPKAYSGRGVSFAVSNGKYTITGTATSGGGRADSIAELFSVVTGHKYYVATTVNMNNLSLFFTSKSNGATYFGSGLTSAKTRNIVSSTFTDNVAFGANVISGATYDTSGYIIISDLTVCFGTTIADYIYSLEQSTAGAGVAKLKEWGFFTEDYYEYCEPTLKSVEGLQSRDVVGFNQWDEEWELGSIANGAKVNSSSSIRGKNHIRVIPNATYFVKTPNTVVAWLYDNDKTYLGNCFSIGNGTITIPEGCQYIRINMPAAYGTTYNHNICINLSDPTRNGQYEPYESHTYPLDSEVVLRGIPKLDSNNNLYFDGDIYPSSGEGTRKYDVVDLGTLNWVLGNRNNDDTGYTFYITGQTYMSTTSHINSICPKFVKSASNNVAWETLKLNEYMITSGRAIVICADYSDAATFKTAMSGVMLVYELATTTTFTAQPYHNPQIVSDTEEFVTTGLVPVGHATKYYQNLRKKIEGLPWNFSSLIAPTEVTNKATRNYTAGSYLILNNVLYKVTANIANGGTISPNSNVTATTIMAEFMSL